MVRACFSLVLTLALTGCASVSVDLHKEQSTPHKPTLIYVLPFAAPDKVFQVDRTGPELLDFEQNLQFMLKTAMVTDLSKRLVPTVIGTKADESQRRNAWLIRGEFVRVNQGSRLLRSAVGFGAGGTKLETRVQVYDLAQDSTEPFMTFATTGGSGAEPGAILALSTDPLQLAVGAVGGAAHGLTEDTKRTARMITAQCSDYMYRHGWIAKEEWIEPKPLSGGDLW